MYRLSFSFRSLFFLLVIAAFVACDKDDDNASGKYNDGTIVVHEGPFQTGTGSLSFVAPDGSVSNKVFELENNGQILGNIVQSTHVSDDRAYIVVNNANKVVIAEAATMKFIGEITGLAQPRYALKSGNKLYVSQWGATAAEGGIAVINLSDNSISKTITLGGGPEHMLIASGKLYVGLSGGFSKDNRLVTIDLATDNVLATDVVGDVPNQMVEEDGSIWLICSGYYDFVNPAESSDGALYELQAGSWTKKKTLPTGTRNLALDDDRNELYMITYTNVQKYKINEDAISDLISGSFYGLGFDDDKDQIWLADPKDYISAGQALVYNRDLSVAATYTVDLIPNGFVFN